GRTEDNAGAPRQDSAIGEHLDHANSFGDGRATGNKRLVERTIGMQSRQTEIALERAGNVDGDIPIPADQNSSVRLHGNGFNPADNLRRRDKRLVKAAVCVKAGETGARDSVEGSEGTAHEHLPIELAR